MSVRRSVRPSVRPSVRRSVGPALFSKVKSTHTRRILCRVSGLVSQLTNLSRMPLMLQGNRNWRRVWIIDGNNLAFGKIEASQKMFWQSVCLPYMSLNCPLFCFFSFCSVSSSWCSPVIIWLTCTIYQKSNLNIVVIEFDGLTDWWTDGQTDRQIKIVFYRVANLQECIKSFFSIVENCKQFPQKKLKDVMQTFFF